MLIEKYMVQQIEWIACTFNYSSLQSIKDDLKTQDFILKKYLHLSIGENTNYPW